MSNTRTCPLCGKEYDGYPAISRTKGREEICPQCGTAQAMTAFAIATGGIYGTQSVNAWISGNADRKSFVSHCFSRHNAFDWGDMDAEDIHTNDIATVSDDRIFSSYNLPQELADGAPDNKIWVITEWNRSSTTILFPDEY